jgi:uncharacterized NAD-dependent epimerase/dehydratase family protein
LKKLSNIPDFYIYGKAALETYIPNIERQMILEIMQKGMNIISGLHQFFSEDTEFAQAAVLNGIQIPFFKGFTSFYRFNI